MDDDFKSSVMIALLPTRTDWCKIDLPHLTLVYCGEIPDLQASLFNDLCKAAISIATLSTPVVLQTCGVSQFGDDPEDQVDVLNMQPTAKLQAMRDLVSDWNVSTFPFSPHCTIGPVGSAPQDLPDFLVFSQIMVAWGNQDLTYTLNPMLA